MPLVQGYDSSSDEDDEEKKNVAPTMPLKKKKETYVCVSLSLSPSANTHNRTTIQRNDDESTHETSETYKVTVSYRAAHILGLK